MSKGTNNFHVGKDYYSDEHTPLKGVPNTNLDTYSKKDGRLKKRRKFGQDGNALKDYDSPHGHKPYNHAHDFGLNGRDSQGRDLSFSEEREFEKAKRKRRFWK